MCVCVCVCVCMCYLRAFIDFTVGKLAIDVRTLFGIESVHVGLLVFALPLYPPSAVGYARLT